MNFKNKADWDAVSQACDDLVKHAFPDATELDKYHASIAIDRQTFRPTAVTLKGRTVLLPEGD